MGTKDKRQEDLLQTLGDFTSKENWDKFFSIRGSDDSFEWYAEWPQLKVPLLSHLSPPPPPSPSPSPPPLDAAISSSGAASTPPLPQVDASKMQILVPGCGNSRLSENLYDSGFHSITNIDFSKVVISDMLRRNVRFRPDMRWRIMDMTSMQFPDESFHAVLDKGGLDALMEPELGPKLGNQYLSEVKRVLKSGGKFVCLTLAESHVLGLLFPKFRYGWTVNVHAIPQKPSNKPSLQTFILIAEKENYTKPSNKPSLQTFMLIAEKENYTVLCPISSSFNHSSLDCFGSQARGLLEALESENKIRAEYSNGSDILYSLEDLKLGAKGGLAKLNPGRRVQLTLGEPGGSHFSYRAVLLDARQQSVSFLYRCGVFLVPKTRAHEWLFSSEEGQWLVVESSKAARLIMVILDSSHCNVNMDDIQKDLSPLVRQLAPGENAGEAQIPFMAASDGIKQRKIVHQVTSALTGPIVVDDVVYEKIDDNFGCLFPSHELVFRRLTFQRTEGLVQSEALLTREGSQRIVGEIEQKATRSFSKSRKKGNQRRSKSHASPSDGSNSSLCCFFLLIISVSRLV
ncbi:unnamed protein product [Ilex paraguariensis]|uniref:Methyltransferase type 11 domain-containing protein n=1 Tax=Ilex paraguariensis TaxID=185542 RepID=A0ABC8R0R1_9AQUA